MASVKESSSLRNSIYSGKHTLLPPKCPFPSIPPSFVDHIAGSVLGTKGYPNPNARIGNSNHIRTSSESFLMEEQPFWLDELLNEPETPLRKGTHRRASSDSTCLNITYAPNMVSVPSWGSLDLDSQNDAQYAPFYTEHKSFLKKNISAHQRCVTTVPEGQDRVVLDSYDHIAPSDGKDFSNGNLCSSEFDTKRAKQQFAQRSRVRKLQYIAELERTVQVLQAEGCEVTAQLEFINQQNVILSMENKALKQRLDSLAQEHLIRHLEHEVLEREIARLHVLLQQQQLPPPSSLRRTSSKDLDSNLSLKLKDTTSGRNPIPGPLRI